MEWYALERPNILRVFQNSRAIKSGKSLVYISALKNDQILILKTFGQQGNYLVPQNATPIDFDSLQLLEEEWPNGRGIKFQFQSSHFVRIK